ncbi:protein pxr1-like [Pitangus sulphuratus]|nr:protein pxr1-like [Pitangus sulphuratus]
MNAPLAKDTKASQEGEEGGAPGAQEEIPLQPVMQTMMRQVVLLKLMEDHNGSDIHLQPVASPALEQD